MIDLIKCHELNENYINRAMDLDFFFVNDMEVVTPSCECERAAVFLFGCFLLSP